jgi:hypothetical protein
MLGVWPSSCDEILSIEDYAKLHDGVTSFVKLAI